MMTHIYYNLTGALSGLNSSLNGLLCMIPEDAKEVVPKVVLSHDTERSTYHIAHLLMRAVDWFLGLFGLSDDGTLFLILYTLLVFGIAMGVGYLATWAILLAVRQLGKRLHSEVYLYLTQSKFFSKASRIIPAIVFLIFIQFTLEDHVSVSNWLTRLTWIYLLYVISRCLTIIVSSVWLRIDQRDNKRHLPLKGIAQLIEGIIWIVFAIVTAALLINKSPGSLLAGLGVFASVLMLIFKDSILGVVAGVQLSENDSLHVGDWIKVGDADGTVLEVSLTAVKVQNWDKTVTTVAPYTLISSGFTNYRPMQESKTRRICRTYNIDADSIVPCNDTMLQEYAKLPLLKDWIEKKIAQKAAGKVCDVNNPEGLVDGSIESNLGVFRAYLKLYLDNNDLVSSKDTCFVCTTQQSSVGLPLQVYCFTNSSAWLTYEAIQCAIFEHIAVMLFRFNLYVFEQNTGRDTILSGFMSSGVHTSNPYGLPYPFYTGGDVPDNPGANPPMPQQKI